MRSIAIINQKGGVGKTTTAVNLSAALAAKGLRVGLMDLDPQAHASLHLGLRPGGEAPLVYDLLTSETPLAQLWQPVDENLMVAGSHIDLAAAEVAINQAFRNHRVRRRGDPGELSGAGFLLSNRLRDS